MRLPEAKPKLCNQTYCDPENGFYHWNCQNDEHRYQSRRGSDGYAKTNYSRGGDYDSHKAQGN